MSLINPNCARKQKFEMLSKKLLYAMRFDHTETLLRMDENVGIIFGIERRNLISYKWSLRKWRREVDGLIIIVFS
jgi:hypothetical protein